MTEREILIDVFLLAYLTAGVYCAGTLQQQNKTMLKGAAMVLFWPLFLYLGLLVGRTCSHVASLDTGLDYVDPNDFVNKWLTGKTGILFSSEHPKLSAQVAEVLNRPLVKTGKFEGLGGCACGISPGRDVRFYVSEELFFTICPRCDSWAAFPTRASQQTRSSKS